ncbi:terpenoid cyclases/Protein prenyltransferase [Trichodelitschia bisporula]|uniref:Protein farnesyltransferase subunit beta n=1 Tax=Trichodelitschia bisporula TaxID=703511 RepID=A0A6G1HYP3_9PEZI|nr:terpenoid cyclases/Protein prenyltransferase [Trichodelitschia bisporula]
MPQTPSQFTELPPIQDSLITKSSEVELATAKDCLPLLANPEGRLNSFGLPHLNRAGHITFLRSNLEDLLPRGFTAADASRPWMLYWALSGLSMLGDDVTDLRDQVVSTLTPMQNRDGGFGGGHGQLSHLATTYASVLSLVTVGGYAALNLINRKTLWHWLGHMKQGDGGFTMCEGGEKDIRGAYCAMTVISLLNLPNELPPEAPARADGVETFLAKLPEWISSCQTFEGGIAGAPTNEAHGAYAFCALACLSIIAPPNESIRRHIDIPALISWLAYRQCAPEGGFAGRTNKLVDGCYSHWVGGCWTLISAALQSEGSADIWSREGLTRYILCCCQGSAGLRDKPTTYPDGYHSCYVLAGLSAAQNVFKFEVDEKLLGVTPGTAAYGWTTVGQANVPGDEEDRIIPVHPVLVVPFERAAECRGYFESKIGF